MLINRDEAITKLEALFAKMAKNRYDRADESLGREVECISEQVTDALRALPVSDGWEDIENVKETDGMVLCAGKWPDGTKWRAIGQAFDGWAVGDWDDCLEPTHFCPLPAPPTID